MSKPKLNTDAMLARIARPLLDCDTIGTGHGSCEYREVTVWQVKRAIRQAFNAGRRANPSGQLQPAVGNDVLCELAHELTVRECGFKEIEVDETDGEETAYSDEAQLVFDDIYEIASGVLEVRP